MQVSKPYSLDLRLCLWCAQHRLRSGTIRPHCSAHKQPHQHYKAHCPSCLWIHTFHLLPRLSTEEAECKRVHVSPEGLCVRKESVQARDEGRGPEVRCSPAVRTEFGGSGHAHGVRVEHGEHVREEEAGVGDELLHVIKISNEMELGAIEICTYEGSKEKCPWRRGYDGGDMLEDDGRVQIAQKEGTGEAIHDCKGKL